MTAGRVLVALALLTPGPLDAQGFAYEGGISLATGTYIFAPRTTTWALATGLAATIGAVTVRAGLPVYRQNTTLLTMSPLGGMPTGGANSGAVADSGAARRGRRGGGGSMVAMPGSAVAGFATAIGDPMLSVTVRALGGLRGSLTVGGAVKAPLADTATFGTGQWDYGVTAGFSWFPDPALNLGGSVALWHLGDFGALDLRDPVYATASVGYLGGGGWGASIGMSAGTTVLAGFPGPASLGASLIRVGPGGAWSLAADVGLTDTTPDLTLGLSWRVPLAR